MTEIEKQAKALYNDYINNHPTIHTNRFPSWDEMSKSEKQLWISKVLHDA